MCLALRVSAAPAGAVEVWLKQDRLLRELGSLREVCCPAEPFGAAAFRRFFLRGALAGASGSGGPGSSPSGGPAAARRAATAAPAPAAARLRRK